MIFLAQEYCQKSVFNVVFLLTIFAISFQLFLRSFSTIHAQETVVNASVTLSICGNDTAELGLGGEECDGLDLAGQTCETAGYQPGILACDYSCSLDVSGCGDPLPSPSPSPSPPTSPAPSPSLTQDSSPTPSSVLETLIDDDLDSNALLLDLFGPTRPLITRLTSRLLVFDLDLDGLISRTELSVALESWVGSYANSLQFANILNIGGQVARGEACDFNNDGYCNLQDFSILLYYTE